MKLMRFAETQGDDFCVAWMDDGKSFIIRKPDEFTRNVVPKFFKATKFSSFTRKLYRWGFRQVNRGIGPDDPIIFGNEHFQRDNAERMTKMKSVTAAATRKEEQKGANNTLLYAAGMKHPLEGGFDETTHKRLMIEHMYQHKAGMMAQNRGFYGSGMNNNGTMSLTNALRPNMGMANNMMHGNNDYMGYQGGPAPNGYQGGPMPNGYQGGPMPNQGMHPHSHQGPYNMQSGGPHNGNGYPNPSTTAEIVNAAIAALRYAN
jgi:HSF-type DNA-binding